MDIIIIAGSIGILLFGSVLLVGAPYLPTLNKQTEAALDMLDLKKGQIMLELGSGDGKVLVAAARRGIYSVGYELNPLLVIWTKLRSWKYRRFISVKWSNFWITKWPNSDGMFVFVLQKHMGKLDNKIMQYKGKKIPYRLVSNTFLIPNKKPVESRTGLSLYIYDK